MFLFFSSVYDLLLGLNEFSYSLNEKLGLISIYSFIFKIIKNLEGNLNELNLNFILI